MGFWDFADTKHYLHLRNLKIPLICDPDWNNGC